MKTDLEHALRRMGKVSAKGLARFVMGNKGYVNYYGIKVYKYKGFSCTMVTVKNYQDLEVVIYKTEDEIQRSCDGKQECTETLVEYWGDGKWNVQKVGKRNEV